MVKIYENIHTLCDLHTLAHTVHTHSHTGTNPLFAMFNNKFLSGDKQAHGVIFNAGYEQGRLELNDLVNEDKINFTVKSKEKWLAAGLNVHSYYLDITIDRRTGSGESWIAYAFTEPRGDKSMTRISHNTFGDCKKLDKSNKF